MDTSGLNWKAYSNSGAERWFLASSLLRTDLTKWWQDDYTFKTLVKSSFVKVEVGELTVSPWRRNVAYAIWRAPRVVGRDNNAKKEEDEDDFKDVVEEVGKSHDREGDWQEALEEAMEENIVKVGVPKV